MDKMGRSYDLDGIMRLARRSYVAYALEYDEISREVDDGRRSSARKEARKEVNEKWERVGKQRSSSSLVSILFVHDQT